MHLRFHAILPRPLVLRRQQLVSCRCRGERNSNEGVLGIVYPVVTDVPTDIIKEIATMASADAKYQNNSRESKDTANKTFLVVVAN